MRHTIRWQDPDASPFALALVALALRVVLRRSGTELLREHWPGPETSLATLLRLGGAADHARVANKP